MMHSAKILVSALHRPSGQHLISYHKCYLLVQSSAALHSVFFPGHQFTGRDIYTQESGHSTQCVQGPSVPLGYFWCSHTSFHCYPHSSMLLKMTLVPYCFLLCYRNEGPYEVYWGTKKRNLWKMSHITMASKTLIDPSLTLGSVLAFQGRPEQGLCDSHRTLRETLTDQHQKMQ